MTLALSAALPLPRRPSIRRFSILEPLRRARPLFARPRQAPGASPASQVLVAPSLDDLMTRAHNVSGKMLREVQRREAKIALVSDTSAGAEAMRELMCSDGYSRLRVARNSREAVDLACNWKPDLVILNLARPRRGGLEILKRLARTAEDRLFVPLLMLSGDSCERVKLHALRSGAHDFLPHPFNPREVQLRVRNLLSTRWSQVELSERNRWLEEKLREKTLEVERTQSNLQEAQAEVVVRLALAAELHDTETGQHTRRVGLSAAMLAQSLGLHEREVEMIQLAAPLHDIGKIAIPDALLLKPGRLSGEEWAEMKTHCRIGAQVLASGQADLMHVAQRIALFHHEHWNGSGYPMGLREEQIPLEARILAVADVFDALTHERPYKHVWSIDEALSEIESQSSRQFDPRIVHAFRDLPHQALI